MIVPHKITYDTTLRDGSIKLDVSVDDVVDVPIEDDEVLLYVVNNDSLVEQVLDWWSDDSEETPISRFNMMRIIMSYADPMDQAEIFQKLWFEFGRNLSTHTKAEIFQSYLADNMKEAKQ